MSVRTNFISRTLDCNSAHYGYRSFRVLKRPFSSYSTTVIFGKKLDARKSYCLVRIPKRVFSSMRDAFFHQFVAKRTLSFSKNLLCNFTPVEYENFSDSHKLDINILLGMRCILQEIDSHNGLPEDLNEKTWGHFLYCLEKCQTELPKLPSLTRIPPMNWTHVEQRDILIILSQYINHLNPLPVFHSPENQGKLYQETNEILWGKLYFTGIAGLSYEKLAPDHRQICDLSVTKIKDGEVLADICSWNGELLLTAGIRAKEQQKNLQLLGLNLSQQGLIQTRLSAQAVNLYHQLKVGLGNVVHPLVLPERPTVIMNSRVLSILSAQEGQAFVKTNLAQLLKGNESVAFLSTTLSGGERYQAFEDEYKESLVKDERERKIIKETGYLNIEGLGKQVVCVSYLKKDARLNNIFIRRQTYYTESGLDMLMRTAKLTIENSARMSCSDDERIVMTVKKVL